MLAVPLGLAVGSGRYCGGMDGVVLDTDVTCPLVRGSSHRPGYFAGDWRDMEVLGGLYTGGFGRSGNYLERPIVAREFGIHRRVAGRNWHESPYCLASST